MNILVINNYYYPQMIGGTEHSVKLLAEGLLARGHSVEVLSADLGSGHADCRVETVGGVKVTRVDIPHTFPPKVSVKRSLLNKIETRLSEYYNPIVKKVLATAIDWDEIDLVYINNAQFFSAGLWEYLDLLGVPVVQTLRDYWLLDPSTVIRKSAWLSRHIHQSYLRTRLKHNSVRLVTAPSRYTLEVVRKGKFFPDAKYSCIPNAIEFDRDLLNRSIEEKSLRRGNTVFLYVGALEKHKGVDRFLEVISRSSVNCTFVFCGSGTLSPAVQSAAIGDPRIVYKGQLNKEELAAEYAGADVLVVPSVWPEPFGRILIEGFQYALPAIASDSGGIPEIVTSTGAGVLYASDDLDTLSTLVEQFAIRSTVQSFFPRMYSACTAYSLDAQLDSFERAFCFATA